MSFFNHYEQLLEPSTFIRLLDLLPGKDAEPLRAELRPVLLSSKPQYIAVSYTWGDPKPKRYIWMNQKPCMIPENPWAIMRRFRSASDVTSIWIDALCIDQSNEVEKNNQVQMMGRIYSESVETRVWLGATADHSEEAFEFINDPSLWPIAEVDQTVSHAVRSLCQRIYWTRAWIRQEVINSKRVILYCGKSSGKFEDLISCCHQADILSSVSHTAAFPYLDSKKREGMKTNTLQMLIERYGLGECQKSRDRIWSLLSLATDWKFGTERLRPNYANSQLNVFHSVLHFCQPTNLEDFSLHLEKVLITKEGDALLHPLVEHIEDQYEWNKLYESHEGEHDLRWYVKFPATLGLLDSEMFPSRYISTFQYHQLSKRDFATNLTTSATTPLPEGYDEGTTPVAGDTVCYLQRALRYTNIGLLCRNTSLNEPRIGLLISAKPEDFISPKLRRIGSSIEWLGSDEVRIDTRDIQRDDVHINVFISSVALKRFIGRISKECVEVVARFLEDP